jgi:hypothetical protein
MLPILGFSTPYGDKSIDNVFVSKSIDLISNGLKTKIMKKLIELQARLLSQAHIALADFLRSFIIVQRISKGAI